MRYMITAIASFIVASLLHSAASAPSEAAQPARLIGQCNGTIYAGLTESDFPTGCNWIEPINYATE